jgi:hypothetical protein
MNKANLCAVLLVAALAGCGGDPEANVVTPPQAQQGVPASALASPSALVQYLGGLAAQDTADPLTLDGAVPPVSETDEPEVVG